MVYQVYKVLDGDTLNSIAEKMNITTDEIIRLNGIDVSDFVPGNDIVLPKNDDLYFSYTVQNGDTIYSIAQKYNRDVDVLYSINGIKEYDYIYPNQELLIPRSYYSIYNVKDGDTLEDISSNLGISIDEIINKNSNLYLIPDQVIIYKRD